MTKATEMYQITTENRASEVKREKNKKKALISRLNEIKQIILDDIETKITNAAQDKDYDVSYYLDLPELDEKIEKYSQEYDYDDIVFVRKIIAEEICKWLKAYGYYAKPREYWVCGVCIDISWVLSR